MTLLCSMVSVVPSVTQDRLFGPALPASGQRAVHGGLVVGLVLSLLALVGPATPAGATSTYLCSGYTGCASAGYSHAGYATASSRMYWRMYAGHNCTNYAAYRMVKAGMPNVRPWAGSGMAYNWGLANPEITDQTPTVGSIAWWNRNSGGVGSSGHVAYVEKVISNREIVVSEDSWGGDFDWRRIVKDGSGWPSGFIHFKNAVTKVITNLSPPTVVGTPQVGAQLTATVGTWQGGPTAYHYQWLANGVVVPGAIQTTYTPTTADLGKTISLRITALRTGYQSGIATSAATTPVVKGAFTVVAPTAVAGTPLVDQVLTATPGTFTPTPEKTAIQWRVDGQIIPGATGRTLPLNTSLVGKTVTALTIARSEGFLKAGSASPPAGPVLAGAIEVTTPYAVTGRPRIDEILTIQPGTYTPPDAAFYYTWLRDGAPFGAFAPTYQPTAADVGHELAVQVRLAKATYLERTEVVPVGLIRTPSTVTVKAAGKRGKAVVNILVTAVGASRPPGEVVVKIGKVMVTARVKEGRARVVVPDLDPGRRLVKVHFTGTTVVEAGRGSDTVQIKQ
jgi:surface antigen